MKPNPIIDILATLMIMAMLIVSGYFWLKYEADKVLQHREERKLNPEVKHEKSAMEKYAPKSFEAVVKRTEME